MSDPRSLTIACAILAAALLSGCGKEKSKEEAGEAATPVTVETAVRGAIDHMVTADAILYPINQANVMPKISAPVKRVLVNRGDHVRAGQIVAELESGDLAAAANETQSQYEQSQAAFQTTTGATVPEDKTKAEADAQTARQVFEAAKKLYDNRVALQREGALAQKLVDDAKVALVQAQSQLETAQRHLEGPEPGEPAQCHRRRAGAVERGQSASRKRGRAAFLRADSQPHQRHCRRPLRLSGRDARQRHAHYFDRRHLTSRCPRQRSRQGSDFDPHRPAGAHHRTGGRSCGQSHGGQSRGRPQHDHRRSLGRAGESGRAAEARRQRARVDHRRDPAEHHRRAVGGAAEFR